MTGISPIVDPDLAAANGYLQAICLKVVEYLRAIPELAPCQHIFTEDSRDLEQDLDRALRGTEPLSMMVGLGEAKDAAAGVPGMMRFDPLEIIVIVFEQPSLNRGSGGSGLTVNRAAELVATRLKGELLDQSFIFKADLRTTTEDLGSVASRTIVLTTSATLT